MFINEPIFLLDLKKLKNFGELNCRMIVYLKNRLFLAISWLITKNLDVTRLFIFRPNPKVIRKQFIRKQDEFPIVSWFYAEKLLYCVDINENKEIMITKTDPIELN